MGQNCEKARAQSYGWHLSKTKKLVVESLASILFFPNEHNQSLNIHKLLICEIAHVLI
jgi:hypothetical protein